MLLTKHFYKQNSHHYINTTLQTLLTGHYTQGTTLMTPRMDPDNSETHPSLHILPLPRTSALRFSVSVVVPLALLGGQQRTPRSTPTHCPACPLATHRRKMGAPRVRPHFAPLLPASHRLPPTSHPAEVAVVGARPDICVCPRFALPAWGQASHPFCPACHPTLSSLRAPRNGGSSPRQTGGTTAPPALALFPHRAMPLSTAFYPPCLAHAEIIIYIMCK